MNNNRIQAQRVVRLGLVSLLSIFLIISCRTIQVKGNNEKQNVSENSVIPRAEDVTQERMIITPESKPVQAVKPPVISPAMTIKQVSRSAVESVKAAPAKVVEISNKIVESVKSETKNAFENWPVFIYVFVGIIIVYIIFDNIDIKSRKKRKKKRKNITKIT